MPAVSGMIRTMAVVPKVHLANPKKNAEEIAALLHKADDLGAQLCVFPELSLTGSTCGDLFMQDALLSGAKDALGTLAALDVKTVFVVGLPLQIGGRVYNCAAVVSGGSVLIVPKASSASGDGMCSIRWFAPGSAACGQISIPGAASVRLLAGQSVIDCGAFTLGVEIGRDFGRPLPPSASLSARGAMIIAHPAAASAPAGRQSGIQSAFCAHSERCICGYVHADAGYGESTTDMVFSGHAGIYECGDLLTQNKRFERSSSYAIADIDVSRLAFKRRSSAVFRTGADACGAEPVSLPVRPFSPAAPLLRPLPTLPFLPGSMQEDFLRDALQIQAQGLIRRMEHIRSRKLVLGVSGGLDSTLALLSAAYAYALAGWDKTGIVGITMPGFGTGSRTKGNADRLMELIGCTCLTIPIGPAVTQHFEDIGQDPSVLDICYENSQARERTQIVMDYANKIGALALGTGDLSELALGWCTYNGDHMSMYNMNGSVPKTLMRAMVAYAAGLLGQEIAAVCADILDTPVSPELIPDKEGELTQRTEDKLGSYELHDFFIWHMMDSGASPAKLYALALQAFDGRFGSEAVYAALRTFVWRFFTQQFKRSAMPDGPQVTPVSLSPRGSWHMPSDAQQQLWMDELDALR